MIGSFSTINAHSRCEVMKIILLKPNHLASIGLDTYLRLWDLTNIDLLRQQQFKYSYLTSMASTAHQFIIGNENGELMFIDRSTLQVNSTIKVQGDCITDILIEDETIITCGNDGILARLDRRRPEDIQKLDLSFPLKQVLKHKGKYYVAGMKSFEVSSDFQPKQIHQSNCFVQLCDNLYGTDYEMGLHCVSKYKSYSIPCENMINYSSGILGSAQSTLTYFSTSTNYTKLSYKSQLIPQLQPGESLLSFATNTSRVFAGSDCGSIHTFTLNL